MDFSKIGSSFAPLGQRMTKGFANAKQYTSERLGSVHDEDITQLPHEYKELEKRIDALKKAHEQILKVARAYTTEGYDYPREINESIVELSTNISHHFTALAARATKDTSIPSPQVVAPPASTYKTLAHALSRAAGQSAIDLGSGEALGAALQQYSIALDKVGTARLMQDSEIVAKFVQPFTATLNGRIKLSSDARRKATTSRLYLDSCKLALKNAKPEKQDAARLEAEQAEDQFVSAVEEATSLMKNVLENPEPVKNLTDFISAQAAFHKQAHDVLSDALNDLESIQHEAESEYRQSRA